MLSQIQNTKKKKTSLQTAITSTERREIKCVRKKNTTANNNKS